MAEKKIYRNAIRSKQMLRAAFEELLHEKTFEKITATDIINRSGLNRSTFYAHYPDVKGIMDELTDEIFIMYRQMLSELDFSEFLRNPEPILKEIMVFLKEHQELYRLLGRSDMAWSYLDNIKKELIKQVLEIKELPTQGYSETSVVIQTHFLMSGIMDTYREWLAGEVDCTLEEMTEEVIRVIRMWINSKNR